MKTDASLKNDVERELQRDPSIDAASIGVAVDCGIVTLGGHVRTFAEKFAVEEAVLRVPDVKGVATNLEVRLSLSHQRDDTEIALAAKRALEWNVFVPSGSVQVLVSRGCLRLSGCVDWPFQSRAAEHAVRHLKGVVDVRNDIVLESSRRPGPRSREA